MLVLERMHPAVYTEFFRDHFTVRKSKHAFSSLAIDQAHEQNNAVIKGNEGTISLTEDQSVLRRWMVAGPDISRLLWISFVADISGNRQTK